MGEALKFFILDSKSFGDVEEALESVVEESGINAIIKVFKDNCVRNLPKNYDCYLIHLSDTFEGSVASLREKQPWSRFYGLNGGGHSLEYQRLFDAIYHSPSSWDIRNIIKETKGIYYKD